LIWATSGRKRYRRLRGCRRRPAAIVYAPLGETLLRPDVVVFACQPNTGIGDEEMYLVLRGRDVARVADALGVVHGANAALHDYAKARREQLSTR
jgi:hypothetical protein